MASQTGMRVGGSGTWAGGSKVAPSPTDSTSSSLSAVVVGRRRGRDLPKKCYWTKAGCWVASWC